MVNYGLVSAKSAKDLSEEDAKRAQMMKEKELNEYTSFQPSLLASHIKSVWDTNKMARWELDERLLYCLRARKGEYSPEELAKIESQGGSHPVFLKLTGTKCRAASSWIRDILLPANERAWKLSPTTEPQLPEYAENIIKSTAMAEIQQMAAQGVQLSQGEMMQFMGSIYDKVKANMKELANVAAKRTENKIQDVMDEGDWRNAIEELIEDFVTYPTAFLKGPYYKKKKVLKWQDGRAVPTEEVVMCWSRRSPFDVYPDPYATTPQEGHLIERLRLRPDQIFNMIGLPGYSEDHIREALEQHKAGYLKEWIWSDTEREQLLFNHNLFSTKPGTIDALHYWGKCSGEALLDWGVPEREVPDPQGYYEVDAILIGNHVIRCMVNDDPMGHRPYHHACWDAVPGSMWGIALPEQMEDHQKIVNACTRALLDNMSIASGPQAVVLVDMLAEGEDITDIFPRKVWQGRSSMTGATGKAVDFFQPEMNAAPLLSVLNTFEQKADDVTNVPRYSYGNEKIGGAGSTAAGLSMLMNSAAKGIRRAISHLDANIIQPTVYQTFLTIMSEDPDPALKGDCKVVPRGSAALLIKDSLQNQRKEFLALISNPIDQEIMGPEPRIKILTEFAKELGMDGELMPTPEQVRERMANRIPPEIQKMQEDLQKAAADLEKQKQAVMAQSQDIMEKSIKVQNDTAMLEVDKNRVLLELQNERNNLEAERNELDVEQEKLDVRKETLAALEQSLRARTEQKEAELERRLAQAERKVIKADSMAVLAQVKEAMAKNDASLAKQQETDGGEEEGMQQEQKENESVNELKSFVEQAVAKLSENTRASRKITIERDGEGKIVGANSTVTGSN